MLLSEGASDWDFWSWEAFGRATDTPPYLVLLVRESGQRRTHLFLYDKSIKSRTNRLEQHLTITA